MIPGWTVVFASLAYLALLFAIAYWGDRRADGGRSVIASPTVYSLSLAVYCTTWTFYGSVGRAAATGIGFLPIYLGPTLMLALGWYVLRKLVRVAKANRITSIADFVASRYGKSQLLGGLVTVIAVIGIIPYIALQLKAVSHTYKLLVDVGSPLQAAIAPGPMLHDSAFYVAVVLAAFSILFGTRHLDATERHEGMVAAIAFESVVKLLAFLAVGLYVTYALYGGLDDIFERAGAMPALAGILVARDSAAGDGKLAALTILSMLSVLLLPRQFQIAVVENVNEAHVRRAVWLFPLYLLLINLFVLPIALGGLMQFPEGDADTFVLTLPLAHGQHGLALLVFVGGLSAATGMVIVETIALSTMICNDLVMPILLRWRRLGLERRTDLSGLLLNIRRGAIGMILLLGYLYFRIAGEAYALVAIGLISFAAVAQFAPVVFGGLYWRGGTREGALAGLAAGFAVWTFTLLLPSFAKSGWLPPDFMAGAFGLDLLRPQQLFGLSGLDEISHSLFWSLLANIACYVGVSLARTPDMRESGQAALFVDGGRRGGEMAMRWRSGAAVTELLPLAGRFLGPDRAREVFARHATGRGLKKVEELPADAELAHFAESQLAGAIGSASARVMVASVVQEAPPDIDAVMDILDEASQARAHSRELEEKQRQLEQAGAELRAANERLRELDRLKDDFISTVSHELRTPLTSIRAFSEMLHDDPAMAEAERARFLAIIINESERLTRLINQTLDLAKLESGRAEWTSAVVDLGGVVRASADALGQVYRDKGVALDLRLPGCGPQVLADRDRLVQVMINLLSNAQKFVAAGSGRVVVAVAEGDDGVRVSVSDNGPGIAAGDREGVFEKFRQGGAVLTDKPSGTGLGLPISRQIVEYFGGRLWAEAAPGGGAAFVFVLPRHGAR